MALPTCAGDVDYYGMDLVAGDHIVASVMFRQDVGDLDIAILDATGNFVGISAGTGAPETIDFIVPASGHYYLLVEGYQGQVNTYDFSVNRM